MTGSLIIPVVIVFLVGLFSWYFADSFNRLLKQLTERNQELEQINLQIETKRKLELHVGERINSLATQVSAAFSEQTRGATEQLSAVVEVTSALEELNQTNEQIAQASGQVASTARETLEVARRGGETIRYSTDAMGLLHAKVNEMANAMENLSKQAREIDQIIELITEVAEETNLLALNATIEAAGAREYGRRFAAVAGEVQRLANRSREAADAVRGVVNEVQEAIKETTYASQQGLHDALELTSSSREIGEAIEGIVSMVQNTANLAQQISLSIQQQKSAGTQVLDTMRQISNISDQVADNSQELIYTMQELNEAADQLKAIDYHHKDVNKPSSGNSSGSSHSGNLTLNPNTL
jgi:methyl-accepting chemotaxis protein